MEISEIQERGRRIHNFLGVFTTSQLNSINILKDNVCLMIYTTNHAIGLYISTKTLDIYDPLGLKNFRELDNLCEFVVTHAIGRKLKISSQIQSDESDVCAKISLVCLLMRSQNINFEDITQTFCENFSENDALAAKLFEKYFD